jgi:hypothetical protein
MRTGLKAFQSQYCADQARSGKGRLNTIIGIAVDAPKYHKEVAEDFLLLDCTNWTTEMRNEYTELNHELGLFASPSMTRHEMHVTDFIPSFNLSPK